VHDEVTVRVLDGLAHGLEEPEPGADAQPERRAVGGDGFAVDELHHQVRPPVGCGPAVQEPRDVGVFQPGQDLALLAEAALQRFACDLPANQLDGDALLELVVVPDRLVDGSHAPAADLPQEAVRPDPLGTFVAGEWYEALELFVVAVESRQQLQDLAPHGFVASRQLGHGGVPLPGRKVRRVVEDDAHPITPLLRITHGRPARLPHFPAQPRLREAPVPLDRRRRDAQRLRHLLRLQPGEEAQLDHPRRPRLVRRQAGERLVKRQQVDGTFLLDGRAIHQRHPDAAIALGRLPATRMIDECTAHGRGRDRQELRPARPLVATARQAEEAFVDQCGGLQCVVRILAAHAPCGDATQLDVRLLGQDRRRAGGASRPLHRVWPGRLNTRRRHAEPPSGEGRDGSS
jgi:hypothetical protein